MIYLTSFTRGFSPSSLVWDVPDSSDSSQAIGEGNNAQLAGEIYHGPVRLRIALANDYLNPARQVMQQVGADNVWRTSRELGLLSLGQTPPSVLSMDDYFSTPVTLLEVTQVFGVIDNHGVLAGQDLGGAGGNGNTTLNPTSVIRMLGVDGREWLDWSSTKSKPILSTQLAYLIHHVLSDETARWPSLGHPNLLEIGRPAGAKLGGSEEGQDAWTVGYVPQMVVSSWVGSVGDEQSQIPPEIAAGLWRALIQYATRDLPAQNWDVPAGISMVDVCDPSGLLPTETCPTVVKEVFLTGSEPTQADHLYQKIQVNRETGNLATVFTPPELVEERVYLVVPPQAMEWAKSAGLPIPPDSYDVIYVPPPTSADVQITAPAMFAHVSGEVSITGHASGKSFSFYRLQVGQGLNPQEWIQVGEDVKTPVEDGLLGVWDASGLSGLYVIQLLVVSQDQRVENNILQVTVDNQPPEVSILSPSDGEQIKYLMGKMIAFQVEADDDLELARVEFYVDDELLVTMVQPPFTILWEAEQGSHTLHVQVYDLAGNMAEKTVTFEVKR
jgi:membrane carboxypeptidase/penicillin-binding protein PbpC